MQQCSLRPFEKSRFSVKRGLIEISLIGRRPACKTWKLENSTSCEKMKNLLKQRRPCWFCTDNILALKVKVQMWIQQDDTLTDQRRAEISLIGPSRAWKDSTNGSFRLFLAQFHFCQPSFIQAHVGRVHICRPVSCAGLHIKSMWATR